MKFRDGFVSNSSSSSFIVGSKEKLDVKNIKKIFGSQSEGVMRSLVCDLSDIIMNKANKLDEEEIKEILEEDTSDAAYINVMKEKGMDHIYKGRFCSDDGGLEEWLYENDIEYISDKIIFCHLW